jgi:hypothetical protein
MQLRFLTAIMTIAICGTAMFSVYHNSRMQAHYYAGYGGAPELSNVPTTSPGERVAN